MVTGSIDDFVVQFWGVRDKISTPGKETIRYGGNTSCVEMRVGNKRLIFDSGTGLRLLGNNLLKAMPVEAYIFFTNCHWDSIQGFPFFIPALLPGNCFHIYGAEASDGTSMEQRLSRQMLGPNFPVPLQVMRSELKFYELTSGMTILLDDVTVETIFLNYSHRAMGYRVTWQGRSVVYAMDRVCYQDHIDQALLHLARQADLLILDVEMPGYSGIELCQVVRNDPHWSNLPILFLTAHTENEAINRAFAAGADDYITKPIVEQQLVTRMINRLDRSHWR